MARLKTRTLRYELRLTPVEKESWSVKAAAVGLDLSEYIRRCVERAEAKVELARRMFNKDDSPSTLWVLNAEALRLDSDRC